MGVNTDFAKKIEPIFMPYASDKQRTIAEKGGRYVHYTSAENALKIIHGKEFWMRDTRCMNDYSEVQHGLAQLNRYFDDQSRNNSFRSLLDSCGEGIAASAFSMFGQNWTNILQSTFITCLSEHDDTEDQHGRLSMWRSYGRGSAGVAIVLKLAASVDPMQLFLSPVAYFGPDQVMAEIERIATNIDANRSFLREIDRGIVARSVYMMLMMAALSLKHPGFHEEREWRVIHSPMQFPSRFVPMTLETIGGIPQHVCKIPLQNIPEEGITGIAIPDLVDRVIIGPSVYPGPIAIAFVAALTQAGIPDAGSRVVISDIPLRT